MGYSTYFYAVDLQRLRNTVGSSDKALCKLFEQNYPDELGRKLYDDDPILEDVFSDLISGSCNHPNASHQYGYSLEILCRMIGDDLPDGGIIGCLGPLELSSPLEALRHPVSIPKKTDVFPRISFLTPNEVQAEFARLSVLDMAFPNSGDIEEAREAYKHCIELAAEKNRAVVTFYY